jgi:hypothetical protein
MVWFFERENERIRVETRFDRNSAEYVVDVARPGEAVETERFRDRAAFRARLQLIEASLASEAWVQVSSELLPPAWRGPFTN